MRGPRHVHRVLALTGADSLSAFDDDAPILCPR
jgi:hypothetical protein